MVMPARLILSLFTLFFYTQAWISPPLYSTRQHPQITRTRLLQSSSPPSSSLEEVDVAIIGAGIGGLSAGAILNTLYNKTVAVYESHYLPGGCAHAFDRYSYRDNIKFTFDSGPTIVLGCSREPFNPLRQVLNAVGMGDEIDWISYDGWGMVERFGSTTKAVERWRVELGPEAFESGPLRRFGGCGEDEEGGAAALREFRELGRVTRGLVDGAVEIPAMAMRSDDWSIVPLLRYVPALLTLISQGDRVRGTFEPYMNGPIYEVKNEWLRNWLDALAFSLSGLPASRTSAAAMAYVLYDMHRNGAALDYPRGGMGRIADVLVRAVEQGETGSKVHLRSHVDKIHTSEDGTRVLGLTLKTGKQIRTKQGVICNAPIWSLKELLEPAARRLLNNDENTLEEVEPIMSWQINPTRVRRTRPDKPSSRNDSLLSKCDQAEMTGSFLHLHLALDATDLDLSNLEAHYTIMDRGLTGSSSVDDDGPCGELNMIALSNPCVLDPHLAPEGYIVIHAYGAGNEPYELWQDLKRSSKEYRDLKQQRAEVLWRAVESIIPDARNRTVMELIGSPLTHERFLRRPKGTYGAATEDYLPSGETGIQGLVLCGDGVFPGIGVPAVALSGASAANAFVGVWEQWRCMDELKRDGLI